MANDRVAGRMTAAGSSTETESMWLTAPPAVRSFLNRHVEHYSYYHFRSPISSSTEIIGPIECKVGLIKSGKPAFERVLDKMKQSPEGRSILLDRPRVISANVGHAWDLPPNTFGAAYAKFMGSRNFSPDDRPPVRFMESDELAYLAMRAREVHDFWHTLFNLPTNLIGESALKVIEFEQMFLPMCLMSVVGGTSRFSEKQRSLFFQHYFPWAAKAGVRCKDLMCIYYEKHFHEDLEDVRKRWGIEPVPPLHK